MPLARPYWADRIFEHPKIKTTVSTDTVHMKIPSMNGCKYAEIFATKEFFANCYSISTKNQADDALMQFIRDYGVPDRSYWPSQAKPESLWGSYSRDLEKLVPYHGQGSSTSQAMGLRLALYLQDHATDCKPLRRAEWQGNTWYLSVSWFCLLRLGLVPWECGLRRTPLGVLVGTILWCGITDVILGTDQNLTCNVQGNCATCY